MSEVIHTYPEHYVTSMCVIPDNRWLLTGSNDFMVKAWEIKRDGKTHTLVGHTGAVNGVCASRMYLFSGSADTTIRMWTLNGEYIRTLDGHTGAVMAVCVSADGARLYSGSADNTINVWNPSAGGVKKRKTDRVNQGAAGVLMPAAQSVPAAQLAPAAPGGLVGTLRGHSGPVDALCVSADGKRLFSGSRDSKIKVWDVATGACVQTLGGHEGWVRSLCLSPDGSELYSGASDTTIKVWYVVKSACMMTLRGHTGPVNALISTDDGRLFSGSGDNTIKVWDVNNPDKPIRTLTDHTGPVTSLCGAKQYLYSGSHDKTIRIWDINHIRATKPRKRGAGGRLRPPLRF